MSDSQSQADGATASTKTPVPQTQTIIPFPTPAATTSSAADGATTASPADGETVITLPAWQTDIVTALGAYHKSLRKLTGFADPSDEPADGNAAQVNAETYAGGSSSAQPIHAGDSAMEDLMECVAAYDQVLNTARKIADVDPTRLLEEIQAPHPGITAQQDAHTALLRDREKKWLPKSLTYYKDKHADAAEAHQENYSKKIKKWFDTTESLPRQSNGPLSTLITTSALEAFKIQALNGVADLAARLSQPGYPTSHKAASTTTGTELASDSIGQTGYLFTGTLTPQMEALKHTFSLLPDLHRLRREHKSQLMNVALKARLRDHLQELQSRSKDARATVQHKDEAVDKGRQDLMQVDGDSCDTAGLEDEDEAVYKVQRGSMVDAEIAKKDKISLAGDAHYATCDLLRVIETFDKTLATMRELAGEGPEYVLSWFYESKPDEGVNQALRSGLTDWFPLALTEGSKADLEKWQKQHDEKYRFVKYLFSENDFSDRYDKGKQVKSEDVLKLYNDLEVKRAAFADQFAASYDEPLTGVSAPSASHGTAILSGVSAAETQRASRNALIALAWMLPEVITLRVKTFDHLSSVASRLDYLNHHGEAAETVSSNAADQTVMLSL
ncbi:uncharacterized protein MKK02DRAFT_29291 [Dioszegia hungarica]|uniref:Uncharacterized protein n=1 Tax=Dioszegia hungarica TaxID=4972 RepID=A0AA38LYP1_9TREE|nr:uncharacterized protein MKK02DRAFT_29291 [Dioszegia hungarica]KAI9639179.1 hypothetical protein MKK02DRAFT_29291 [Dioszegia hungarica]